MINKGSVMQSSANKKIILSSKDLVSRFEKMTPSCILHASKMAKTLSAAPARIATD